ncbi:hypothetical protein L1049_028399 [Liquidambar formosana]|uniref:Uncharacterized protein n=1 Tax=Liquidambar formosana TaxID=63359 RepID=A0AAP0RJL7_LIQFO
MSMRPGFYYEIGKKARDLLYRDYTQQQPLHYHYRFIDWSVDLSLQIEDIAPGLNAVFRFIVPDYKKVEVGYLSDYAGITAGITLAANPFLSFSGVVGTGFFSLGTELTFDTAARMFTDYSAGLRFNTAFLIASLALTDKGDTLNATCFRTVNTLTKTAIAAELSHSLSLNETAFAIGTQHGLTPFTLIKARVNTYGQAGALIQHELWQKFYFTISGEVDARDNQRFPKVGLSIALRP